MRFSTKVLLNVFEDLEESQGWINVNSEDKDVMHLQIKPFITYSKKNLPILKYLCTIQYKSYNEPSMEDDNRYNKQDAPFNPPKRSYSYRRY